MNSISVVVLTYNEEKNIGECLSSVKWADEIIIVDSGSSDNTLKIAESHTKNIISTENIAYGLKRNIGFEHASCDWILWLDADERIPEVLADEIKIAISNTENGAFLINRRSYFINRFINHCGWFPDYTLRLFKKSLGLRFNEAEVHEQIIYGLKSSKLINPILHFTDMDFEHYVFKLNNYTSLSAEQLAKKGRNSTMIDLIFRPVFTFIKLYFLKLGFMDGYTGLILCILSSYHVAFKYAKNSVKSI